MAICLLDAANDVIRHCREERRMIKIELDIYAGAVALKLFPSIDLTWGQWGTVIRGMITFVTTYDVVDFEFLIRNRAGQTIGGGILQ